MTNEKEKKTNEENTNKELDFLGPELQPFAQRIIEELAREETRGETGFTPEIIDHHTADGQKRLKELMKQCKEEKATFNPRPYKASHEELIGLAAGMKNVPNTEQEIINHMVKTIKEKSPNISQENIESLITANSLPKDLLSFSSLAKELGSSDEIIEKDSRFIWFSENKTLIQMIGHDAYHLLIKSRLLGLIPFEALDKLRKLKIKVAGASAVIHLIDLLACIGAENISWWDPGLSAPSNLGRLGGIGNLKNLGSGKASSLQTKLYDFNPYANFSGTQGKVVDPSLEKPKIGDVDYDEFMKDADFVIEVIDGGDGKIGIRLHARDNHGKKKILFLADVSKAFVGIENPADSNHFNQDVPEEVFEEILDQFKEISESEDSLEKSQKEAVLNLKSVVKMLGKDFPPEHRVQFLYIAFGLMPFWSQTPISARESAVIGTKLILKMLMGENQIVGKNYTSDIAPQTLMPEYTDEQLETLDKIMKVTFN